MNPLKSKRHGTRSSGLRPPPSCVVDGCPEPIAVKKHGLCYAHLRRYYRHGEVGSGKIVKRTKQAPFRPKAKGSV